MKLKTRTPRRKFISRNLFALAIAFFPIFGACSDAKDLIDLAIDPPGRKPIDVARTGVNNFFVDRQFGSVPQQFDEIKNTLGLKFVRVLFAWTDSVQRSPNVEPGFGLFDQILDNVPPGVDVLIVLSHTPSWMANPANWIDGDPRKTWVEKWVRPVLNRYKGRGGIVGWEVWNEPDIVTVPSDGALQLTEPENYVAMLRLASAVIRSVDPGRLVVIAATQSIQVQFPTRFNYNKEMRDLGAQELGDIWNIHYYGTSFESIVASGGIGDFLNGLGMPIWITESGETGPNEQLAYVETAWPFLREQVPAIDRIYYFEFGSTAALDNNFGLRTTDASFPVSDLYIFLRDG